MKWLIRVFCVAGICAFSHVSAQAQEIVTALSESVISITTSFQGTELTVFGAVPKANKQSQDQARDIVVVIRGPAKSVVVRRKARVAGIWVNRHDVRFDGVPSFYALASTRKLADIASDQTLAEHAIGYTALALEPGDAERGAGASRNPAVAEYRLAILRHREQQGLFTQQEGALDLFGEILFRAKFDLPATIAPGIYQAEVYLFSGGELLSSQMSPLYVDQYGFERFLYSLAHKEPFLYGLSAVVIALLTGFGVASLFRSPMGH